MQIECLLATKITGAKMSDFLKRKCETLSSVFVFRWPFGDFFCFNAKLFITVRKQKLSTDLQLQLQKSDSWDIFLLRLKVSNRNLIRKFLSISSRAQRHDSGGAQKLRACFSHATLSGAVCIALFTRTALFTRKHKRKHMFTPH